MGGENKAAFRAKATAPPYTATLALPIILFILYLLNNNFTFCLVPGGVSESTPSMRTHVLVGTNTLRVVLMSSATSLSTMTCKLAKQLPSLISKKAKAPAPASRPVFTQPPTRTVRPTRARPSLSELMIVLTMVRP